MFLTFSSETLHDASKYFQIHRRQNIDSMCRLVEAALRTQTLTQTNAHIATQAHTVNKGSSVPKEQKPEGSHVANLHVQHHVICINLH